MVKNPEPICKNLKSSMSDIPVTISALIIGILVIPMTIDLVFLDNPIMAIQVTVPIIVAITVEITAIESVLISALATASSSKRFKYHLKVKPHHFALDLLALKERTIKVIIGAYIKIRIRAR
jgi:hypothetical protein